MSARRFSRNVPRAVQHAVLVAEDLADAHNEVVGGMPALQKALNHDSPRATRGVVAAAEAWGFLKRKDAIGHGPRRVFVVEARLNRSAPPAPVSSENRIDA